VHAIARPHRGVWSVRTPHPLVIDWRTAFQRERACEIECQVPPSPGKPPIGCRNVHWPVTVPSSGFRRLSAATGGQLFKAFCQPLAQESTSVLSDAAAGQGLGKATFGH